MRVNFIHGLPEDSFSAKFKHYSSSSLNNVSRYAGIGYNSVSIWDSIRSVTDDGGSGYASNNAIVPHEAEFIAEPAIGWNFAQALEYSTASGVTTWFGDNGGLLFQNCLTYQGWW